MTRVQRALLLVTAGLASACVTQIERTPLQARRLVAEAPRQSLRCAVALTGVEDARPDGESAGVFNGRALQFEGAPALLREELVRAGASGADAAGLSLTVQLKRLYMAQQHGVNTPVVVLQAQIGDTPPFLIRPQAPSVNWWGSEAELYADLGAAVTLANAQLVARVNQQCPSTDGG